MKNVVLFLLLFTMPCTICSQNRKVKKHTTQIVAEKTISFMGVKLGMSYEDTKKALLEKGFYEKNNSLCGKFWRIPEVELLFSFDNNNISEIEIYDFSDLYYADLIEDLRKKYGTPQQFKYFVIHEFYWNVDDGEISVLSEGNKNKIFYRNKVAKEKREMYRKSKQSSSNDL